jgi:hypothetical protein
VIASFAFIALALAATGIYALISMSTAQRARDRRPHGARRGSRQHPPARRLRGLALTVAGLVLGALAAIAVTRFLRTPLLFESRRVIRRRLPQRPCCSPSSRRSRVTCRHGAPRASIL